MNTQVESNEETTKEDKFFGITTSIEEMLPKDDAVSSKEEIIIENAEDTPEEVVKTVGAGAKQDDDIEEYGDKVQKRIKKMTWETKEAERQRDTANQERDEAYRVAKQLHTQSQQQAQIISTGEARLVQEIKDKAGLAIEQARARYAKAYEEGNTEAILKAQEEMITAKYQNESALNYGAEYEHRVRNWAAQQQQRRQQPQQYAQPQPQRPQVKKPSSESVEWASKNTWFGQNEHRDMTAIAYATHETMIRDQGIQPDSDEYYEKLDATMRHRFPEFFEVDQGSGHSTSSTSQPHAVVAPATRSATGGQRKVRLNASQRSLARSLGITEEQYAKQLLKENNRG